MLQLSKIEYGVQPFGSDAGSPAFAFHFSEDENSPIVGEEYQKQSADDMYKKMKTYVKDSGLDKEWEQAQCGLIPMYFIGSCYSDVAYGIIDAQLVYNIESDAIKLQKVLYDLHREEVGKYDNGEPQYRMQGNWDKLRPPTRIFVGKALHVHEGDFFQTMQCTYINCAFTKDDKGNLVLDSDIFALTQMTQANTSHMLFRIHNKEELDAFIKLKNDKQHPVGLRWTKFVWAIIEDPELDISSCLKGDEWFHITYDLSKVLKTVKYIDFEI